jgi:hypothetical protein
LLVRKKAGEELVTEQMGKIAYLGLRSVLLISCMTHCSSSIMVCFKLNLSMAAKGYCGLDCWPGNVCGLRRKRQLGMDKAEMT